MFSKSFSLLALASFASAQAPSLAAALNSTSSLSLLNGVLAGNPALLGQLGGLTNITILAPSNAAFAKVSNATLAGLTANTGLLTAVLQYHVLNGTYNSSAITNTSTFVHSSLTNPLFTNVTGGQVVNAISRNGNVTFYSGLLANSTVTTANVAFSGGVIHIIDTLLTLPETASDTLAAANLTSLRGALNATNLVNTVNTTPNITIFAPNNQAIQNIGSGLANLTSQQITDILTYHVVASGPSPGYSSKLRNGTVLTSVQGQNLTITFGSSGRIFVNSARVVVADILIANGVVHVIDAVLNPTNQTIAGANATAGAAAYSGASSVSQVPYTSGQPTPTTTIGAGATQAADPTRTGAASSSSAAAAAPMKTGAVGLSALIGAAAVYFL